VDGERFARAAIAIGTLLVFSCAALRTWGAAYLRTAIVHDSVQHSDALVADGPFRYTRNPLYLASVPGFIFLVVANWIFVYRLILREEEALQLSQGESYRAYYDTVPRFWPSLRPRLPPGNRRPQWGQALGGESFVWIFGLAESLVAVTLRPLAALIAFPFGFLAHLLISSRIQKRGRQAGYIARR